MGRLRQIFCGGWLALLAAAVGLSDSRSLALKAKADFEKVESSPSPVLKDAVSCMESQAEALSTTRPRDLHATHYRRGYCALIAGAASGDRANYGQAALEFKESLASWPEKQPAPSGVRVLYAISRLERGQNADGIRDEDLRQAAQDLQTAATKPTCPGTSVMPSSLCQKLVNSAKLWLGWIAYRDGNLSEATRIFQSFPQSTWNVWISGRQAFAEQRWAESANLLVTALQAWSQPQESSSAGISGIVDPVPDPARAHYDVGAAYFLAKDYERAISSLDESVKINAGNPDAIFLRGRARELLGQREAALADYELASQTVVSGPDAQSGNGQNHFYKGVFLFRRNEFDRAESEFAGALNAGSAGVSKADIVAWRNLAAVAGGACQASASLLTNAAQSASDFFPRSEAEQALLGCRLKQASTLEQLLAIGKESANRLSPAQQDELQARIADMYANQGIGEEDRKDLNAAVIAYKNALVWNPRNIKARFNLGAIHIGEKKYDLAEAEYRAAVEADPKDYESQYWLAESILAQRPDASRKAEACEYLRRSLSILSAEKRMQFRKRVLSVGCAN